MEGQQEHTGDAQPSEALMQDSSLPWYLRVQAQEPASPAAKREALPDMPHDAPESLQAILEYLSIDIGLDDLTLLDLRHLDPPPALGSNMIMVIGTARSEKHLHVSADRFCRWLRTEHKFRPFADGLLGRNELKLKLRRKARRAKLLGSTLGKGDQDDGIRSDWICVNVGPIEQSKVVEEATEEEGIIGFGGREDGTKLVVQMATEAKRGDLDLEKLWTGFLRRQARRDMESLEQANDESPGVSDNEVGLSANYNAKEVADSSSLSYFARDSASAAPMRQTRGYHTSSRLRTTTDQQITRLETSDIASTQKERLSRYPSLNEKIEYLYELKDEQALNVLGMNAHDRDSTSFLAAFYLEIPITPNKEHWDARCALLKRALEVGHIGYSTQDMISLLSEAQESAGSLMLETYESTIQALADLTKNPQAAAQYTDTMEPLSLIMGIIDDMSLRDMSAFTPTIIDNLFIVLNFARHGELEPSETQLRADAGHRLANVLHSRRIPVPSLDIPIAALHSLATMQNWTSYWRYWALLPAYILRRPQILYTTMFLHMAQTQNQRICFDALLEWVPHLRLEQPNVKITGDLSLAIMECLRIADPAVEGQVQRGENTTGRWVRLWRTCELGLEVGTEDTQFMQAETRRLYGRFTMEG
jgi:hypothetical protein